MVTIDEHFVCERESLNSSDRYTMAILKEGYRSVVSSCHKFYHRFCWKMVQLIVWLLAEEDSPQIYHKED